MPTKLMILLCLLICIEVQGQNIGIGTTNPDPSAKLDINSSTSGLLVPRMSTSQRIAISNPSTGLLVFDSTDNKFWFFENGVWSAMAVSNNVRFGFDLDKPSGAPSSYNIPFVANYNLDPSTVSLPNSTTLQLQRAGLYRFGLLGLRHTENAASATATSATFNLSVTVNSKQYRIIVNGVQIGASSSWSYGSTALSFDLYIPANSSITINANSSNNTGFLKADTGHFFGYLISD